MADSTNGKTAVLDDEEAVENAKLASPTTGRYAARRARNRHPMSMEFPDALYNDLRRQREYEEKSMASLIRAAVREYIYLHGPPADWMSEEEAATYRQ